VEGRSPSARTSLSASAASVPSGAKVIGWQAKWCKILLSATRDEVKSAMVDQPTQAFPGQDDWFGYEWQFNAFYNADGSIHQLDMPSTKPSEAAAYQCSEGRFAP
jgi:hypothetical protein